MNKIFLIGAVIFSSFLHAQTAENAKKVEPTLEVGKAFEKDFPKTKPVWRKEYGGEDRDQLHFEADFMVNNTNMTAVYNAVGSFKVLEVEIKPAAIPAKISGYLQKNYPKNTIKKAARLMTNDNKITYEIGITINGKWVDAIFNKEGDFLEMVQKD